MYHSVYFHFIKLFEVMESAQESQSPFSFANDMRKMQYHFMVSTWENEKYKKMCDRETEQSFNDDEYNEKFLYFCRRYNERSRLEGLLDGPLASADLHAIKDGEG